MVHPQQVWGDIQSGAHKRRSIATAGAMSFNRPRSRRCTQGRTMRRICGPLLGSIRGTSPWCPPALVGLAATMRAVLVASHPAKHHGGVCLSYLLPLPRWHAQRTWTILHVARSHQGHGSGGEMERRLQFRHGPPLLEGKGDVVSTDYRQGGVWPAGHGGLVDGLISLPPLAHGTSAERVSASSHLLHPSGPADGKVPGTARVWKVIHGIKGRAQLADG